MFFMIYVELILVCLEALLRSLFVGSIRKASLDDINDVKMRRILS
jgi:hypothetical protein